MHSRTLWRCGRLRARGAALLGAAFLNLVPVTSWAESLTDALIAAYRNSNLLEQNRATLRAADEEVAVAISALRPTLDFIANFNSLDQDNVVIDNRNNSQALSATFQLEATWRLFDGGQRALQVQLQKETVLATREALLSIEQDVLLDAVDAYMDVLSAEAFVGLAESNLSLSNEELRAARDRFEVGEVTRTDVALAESRVALSQSQLEQARGNLTVGREAYRLAVGRYPGQLFEPANLPETADSLDAARNVALRRHPQIRQAQRQVTVADITAEVAQRGYSPTVDFTGSVSVDDLGQEDGRFGLRASQRLYSGGRLPAQERAAIAQRDASLATLHQTTLRIQEATGLAWSGVSVARAQIAATAQEVEAATIAFEGTREEASLGARTTLDVLNAQQDLLDAQARQIQAQADLYVAIYQLLSAMGLLTVEHLNLGIQTYDPSAYYNAVKTAPARHTSRGEKLDRVLRRIGQ